MPASIAGLADGAHVVQFYSDDAVLVDVLSRIVGTSLVVGDSALVFATDAHESALRRRLCDRGLDPQIAIEQGRYVSMNAREVLHRIVRDGGIDGGGFREYFGGAIAAARAASDSDPQRVVVFGEAACLLLRGGVFSAALELEKLWNELLKIEPFALCCGYDMRLFRGENPAAPFLHVCGQHSQVFPAERRSAVRLTRAIAADRR